MSIEDVGARAPLLVGRTLLAASFGLISLGCAGERWVLGSGSSGVSADAAPDADAGDAGAETEVVPMSSACPSALVERRSRPGCWPTRHVGRWRGFVAGDARYVARDRSIAAFPPLELLLTMDPSGVGALALGDAPPPAPPAVASDPYLCRETSPASGCPAAHQIVPGFSYSLERVQLFDAGPEPAPRIAGEQPLVRGEVMRFEISLGEPWRVWCALQQPAPYSCGCVACAAEDCPRAAPLGGECTSAADGMLCGWLSARATDPCQCTPKACAARERPLVLELQMSAGGDYLRGSYLPSSAELPPVRVELSREAGP